MAEDATAPAAALLDPSVVEEMIAAMRPGAFAPILRSLLADHAARMDRMAVAASVIDFDALAGEAHDLASTLGSFGGIAAADLARALVRAARSADRAAVGALLPAVMRTADATAAALRDRFDPR